jgi:hypothetical protein
MFLNKQSFDDSLRVLENYKESMNEDGLKLAIATDFAKDLFEDFESMKDDQKGEVLTMIMEDMAVSIYSIH